jgi:ATP-dependent DNA helicase RecG
MRAAMPTDLRRLIAQGMGPELHWLSGDPLPARLAQVLVGMANASGGKVILGISSRGAEADYLRGVPDLHGAMEAAFQAAMLVDPPLVLPMPQVSIFKGKQLLVITVPAGLPNVYNLDGRYLVREGTRTSNLSARQLRQLLLERGVIHFEAQTPPGIQYSDLEPARIEAYAAALQLPEIEPAEEILRRRGCLDHSGRPTYAAVLMFGREPQRWLVNASILAARFSGVSFADQYIKQEISGTLPEQLYQAERFVRENLHSVVRVQGLTHQETPQYPLEAVRELLVNAVAHRDYNQQGDTIHLNIFADRIEVQSPGSLPGPVTLENLLEARFSRNAVIVQVLADMGFIERLGYGLDRVVRVMRQNGLRLPRFEEVAGSFRVTLYGDAPGGAGLPAADLSAYRALELNSRQELALSYLFSRRRISSRDYQELCPGVHPETLRRDLADLVGRGLLVKIGDKKSTYYVLKK